MSEAKKLMLEADVLATVTVSSSSCSKSSEKQKSEKEKSDMIVKKTLNIPPSLILLPIVLFCDFGHLVHINHVYLTVL